MPAMDQQQDSKSAKINLRATDEQKTLFDRAATRLGKSLSAFMLESAREAAENTLLDQRLFMLDDRQYSEFVAILDAPAKPSKALKKLLATPAPWDK